MRNRFILAVPALLAFAFPFSACADLVGTVTLTGGERFSFDTGVTTSAATAAGDLRFSGTGLLPQPNVGIFNFKTSGAAGAAQYNSLTQQALAAIPASSYTETTLNNAALVVGDVFAVPTVAGYYAQALITAHGGRSLRPPSTTFGVPSAL